MKLVGLTGVGIASLAVLAWHAPAMADGSIEDRLATMEQRIKYLEERVAAQDQVIVEKEREIAALSSGEGDAWFNRVEIGGVIELEAVYAKPYEGDNASEADVGKAEIGIAAAINDWTGSEIVVAYNGDDGDMELDSATLTIAPPEGPWSLTGGLQGLPFGVYETTMISDPLTKELGEAGEVSLVLGLEAEQFTGSLFVFDGDNQPDGRQRIEGHGAALGYAIEQDGYEVGLDVAWINDIGDSDGLQDVIAEALAAASEELREDVAYNDHVAGMSASARIGVGDISVLGEYVAAVEDFESGEVALEGQEDHGAKPTAWIIEAAYGFTLAGKDATFAVGYQKSDEAFALGLPETRMLGTLSVDVMENVGLALEWARDDDYSVEDGGTGKSADTVTTVLSAEF